MCRVWVTVPILQLDMSYTDRVCTNLTFCNIRSIRGVCSCVIPQFADSTIPDFRVFNPSTKYEARANSQAHLHHQSRAAMARNKAFFASPIGKKFTSRLQLSSREIDSLHLEDYKPFDEELFITSEDGSKRVATQGELDIWRNEDPAAFRRYQITSRIQLAKDLTEGGIPNNVAWAVAFKRFPSDSPRIRPVSYPIDGSRIESIASNSKPE
jgi:hypothetical protein